MTRQFLSCAERTEDFARRPSIDFLKLDKVPDAAAFDVAGDFVASKQRHGRFVVGQLLYASTFTDSPL